MGDDDRTREIGYFAIGILPLPVLECRNCGWLIDSIDDACPSCGDHVCRVCGCTDSACCLWTDDEGKARGCVWVDRDKRLCSRCTS